MMYLKVTLLSFFLFAGSVFTAEAQSQQVFINISVLRGQATKMAQALMKRDYKTFVKYTHPVVIKKMGGEEKMIKSLAAGVQNTALGGYMLVSFDIRNVLQVERAGNELHAIVADNQVMTGELGTLTTNSYLLAISKDNGQKWLFVDATNLTEQKAKALFPNYNPALIIPAKQQPVFVRKPR